MRHVSMWSMWRSGLYVCTVAVLSLTAMSVAAGCEGNDDSIEVTVAPTDAPAVTTLPDPTTEPADDVRPDDERALPDPSTLPDAVAPAGLGDAPLPDDAERVTALFEALPDDLLGATRDVVAVDPATIAARYESGDRTCAEIGLQAIDLSADEGSFYPEDWRAQHLVALFASGADWDVEQAGHDGDVYWVTFETYCGEEGMDQDEIISAAVWGEEDSPWFFSAGASDDIDRTTLITAFVDAAAAVADE